MKSIKKTGGFTLVELIIVIAILAVLASIAVPNLLGSVEKSRIAKDEANAKLIGDGFVAALAMEDLPSNLNITTGIVWEGDGHVNSTIAKTLSAIPKIESKKYRGLSSSDTFRYLIVGDKVEIFVLTNTTKTKLYPTIEDTVDYP